MAYCTQADIEKLLPEDTVDQLTDDEGTGAQVATRVSEAIASADAEIDAWCGGRYTIPFATVPDVIKKVSVDIAIYNLYSRTQEGIPETRSERYRNAMKFLEKVATGTVSLGEDPEPAAGASAAYAESNVSASTRIFTRDLMKGF